MPGGGLRAHLIDLHNGQRVEVTEFRNALSAAEQKAIQSPSFFSAGFLANFIPNSIYADWSSPYLELQDTSGDRPVNSIIGENSFGLGLRNVQHPRQFELWDASFDFGAGVGLDIFNSQYIRKNERSEDTHDKIAVNIFDVSAVVNETFHTPLGALGLGLRGGPAFVYTKIQGGAEKGSFDLFLLSVQLTYTVFVSENIFFGLAVENGRANAKKLSGDLKIPNYNVFKLFVGYWVPQGRQWISGIF